MFGDRLGVGMISLCPACRRHPNACWKLVLIAADLAGADAMFLLIQRFRSDRQRAQLVLWFQRLIPDIVIARP
jgi:hypothetical protein